MYGISMLKTTKCWWKKLKKIQVNGRLYHAHGLEASAEFKKNTNSPKIDVWHNSYQ